MRIKYLLLIIVLLFLNTAGLHAQTGTGAFLYNIEGTAVDSLDQEPVTGATILLASEDAKPAIMTMSDENGHFKLENIGSGSYTLNISYTGYRQVTMAHFNLPADSSKLNLGTISLVRTFNNLATVVIEGSKPVIENKIDRFIYNAVNDATALSGDATDLMRKVPMVSVDMDGNVALRGSRSVRVLIDGKPTGALSGNIGDILQSIPATQIKSVEVMVSPSGKYDAEGSGGIINIITKRKALEGINGSIAGGIGTRQWTTSASVNALVKKLSIALSGGISNKWPRNVGIDAYNQDNKGNTSSSTGTSVNERFSNNSALTLEYDFNEQHSLSSTFHSNSVGYNDDLHVNATTQYDTRQDYEQWTKGKMRSSGFDWNTDYLVRFKKKGEELDFAFQWSNNTSKQNYRSLYSDYITNQQADNNGKNNEYTFQADYTLPVTSHVKLDAGTKGIFRNIESLYDYYEIASSGEEQYDAALSNVYNYKQQVYAGYLVLDFNLEKGWELLLSNRFEATRISGSSANAGSGLLPFSNHYNNYVPGLTIMKSFGESQSLKISYSKRIQRPSLLYLNPFRNTSDPLNHAQGSPDLSPEEEQTWELGYNLAYKVLNFSASVYYKRINNLIESFVSSAPYVFVDQNGDEATRMVALTNFGNIGSNKSFGLSVYGTVDLPFGLSLRGNMDMYSYDPSVKPGYETYLNAGTFLMYNGYVSASYNFKKKIYFESSYSFQSKWRTFQGVNANLNVLNIGVKKNILKNKGSIGFVVVNLFKDKWDFTNSINTPYLVQYRNLSTPFRSFNLNFSYKIGNFKMKNPEQRGVSNDDLK